jgi:glutamyl-tRNA synthetase
MEREMNDKPARTRYAPSPTGLPHIGNIRTALYDYLWSRHTGGQFILRIEDTDQKRSTDNSLEGIKDSLRWLGLTWDEGPDVGGPFEPYTQSERLPIYQQHAETLLADGKAYYCYCTKERLDAVRRSQEAQHLPPGYDRRCRNISQAEIEEALAVGVKPVVRFKVPLEGQTTFHDHVRGPITVKNASLDDLIIVKSDGFPTYHLAAMVDDHLMEITHILRGEEWLPTTPMHQLIMEAFGWEPPVFVHTPIILNPPGVKGKLSKREGSVFVGAYREAGYLPEALLNYLLLMGWSYDDHHELFMVDNIPENPHDEILDLVKSFDIKRIQPTASRFVIDKLDWFNAYYINHILTDEQFAERCIPFLLKAGVITEEEAVDSGRFGYIKACCKLVKDKAVILADVPGDIDFMFRPVEELDYPTAELIGKNPDAASTAKIVTAIIERIEKLPEAQYHHDGIYQDLDNLSTELGLKRGLVLWPARVAMCGRKNSPDGLAMMEVYGREETLKRLRLAEQKLLES